MRKCLFIQCTSPLSLDEDVLYIETQSLLLIVGNFTRPPKAVWSQNEVTVAAGNGWGSALNQLNNPFGLDIDDDNPCIVIAEWWNHRIVEWNIGASNGKLIVGGRRNRRDQLNDPIDVLIDKETNSLFICDRGNRRVLQWSRLPGTTQGQLIVDEHILYRISLRSSEISLCL